MQTVKDILSLVNDLSAENSGIDMFLSRVMQNQKEANTCSRKLGDGCDQIIGRMIVALKNKQTANHELENRLLKTNITPSSSSSNKKKSAKQS